MKALTVFPLDTDKAFPGSITVYVNPQQLQGVYDVPPGVLFPYAFRFRTADGRLGELQKGNHDNTDGINRVTFSINWDPTPSV
jgi:hypothetical protein